MLAISSRLFRESASVIAFPPELSQCGTIWISFAAARLFEGALGGLLRKLFLTPVRAVELSVVVIRVWPIIYRVK